METWIDLPETTTTDFIAGFIFGLTGDNQPAEIESCYVPRTPDVLSIEL